MSETVPGPVLLIFTGTFLCSLSGQAAEVEATQYFCYVVHTTEHPGQIVVYSN